MHKMYTDFSEAIDFDGRHVLRYFIQTYFLVRPTVVVAPVSDGVLDHIEGDTILFSPFFASKVRRQTY